ncbi:MAG: Zn-dependent hydrolase [Bacteroidales bacterium]|nr:Zn-dependent hydrolase [Bacteroidales bacterium]
MRAILFNVLTAFLCIILPGCNPASSERNVQTNDSLIMKLNDFATFRLTTDLSVLSENQKKMIPILIEAAQIMDEIFWMEAFGDRNAFLESLDNNAERQLGTINYGPWERLNDNRPFAEGFGPKPPGANFYPAGLTKEEFESFDGAGKTSSYTLIRRDVEGKLRVVPYHEAFRDQVETASGLILEAAALADDPGFKEYLKLRAEALLSDNYYMSDMAWMEMKENIIDFVVGPIETYEDQLFGYKASHEAFILIKDLEWTERLSKYEALLPLLQEQLPVDGVYKSEIPGSSSDLGVYDAIYYAGDCNAGSKTIAINLPNDERVQQAKGSRRLQLKNAMQAKFDEILVPIGYELISESDRGHITFDAFFTNTMFHEIAHGLGCNHTINGKGTVREALKEHYTTIEESKADILGLYLVTKLNEMGVTEVDLMDSYTTFLTGIFRSVRFGASSAHGRANLIRFNYFREQEAFRITDDGHYAVDFGKMQEAVLSLSNLIITIQGDGDYDKAGELIETYGIIDGQLKSSLQRIEDQDIPVDIVFEQGLDVLGL